MVALADEPHVDGRHTLQVAPVQIRTSPGTRSARYVPSARRTRWTMPSNAPDGMIDTDLFGVTHPFHPLFGREFEFVHHRRNWGEDRLYFRDEQGILATERHAETGRPGMDMATSPGYSVSTSGKRRAGRRRPRRPSRRQWCSEFPPGTLRGWVAPIVCGRGGLGWPASWRCFTRNGVITPTRHTRTTPGLCCSSTTA